MSELPSREQIKAISDIPALKAIRDEIELAATLIETNLEFRDADDDWAFRARNALGHHRFASRIVRQRLAVLEREQQERETPDMPIRPESENDPKTNATLAGDFTIDPTSLNCTEEADAATRLIAEHTEAVTQDREDEIARPSNQRDTQFLGATAFALKRLAQTRQLVQNRRGELSRAQKTATFARRNATREALFCQAARETLDKDTYLRLWDRVDLMEGLESASPMPWSGET